MYRRDPTSSKSVGVDHRLKKLSKISIVAIDIQIFSQVLRIPGFFVQIPEPDSNSGSCIRVINYQGQFEFALPSASLGSLIKVVKINVKNGNLCPTSELKLSNIVGENCFQSKSRSRSLYPPPTFSSCVGLKEPSSATQSYYSISLLPNGETHNKNMLQMARCTACTSSLVGGSFLDWIGQDKY